MGEELEKQAVASALLLAAKEMGLEMRHHLPVEEVARIYNGVGPEWMREELRAKADKLSQTLLPAVMIHDVDYEYGTGTMLDFQLANRRLEANGRKCADYRYGWYNPMRYIVRHQAKAYAKFCDLLGFPAYAAAVEERKKHNHETENKEA
jgi:hypothetical protein